MWRNPRNSALVLGGATVVFAFLQFAKVNAIQTSAYVLLAAVLGCFLWNNIASFTHRCGAALQAPAHEATGVQAPVCCRRQADMRMHADRLRYGCRRVPCHVSAPQAACARAAAAEGGRERGASQGHCGGGHGARQQGPGCVAGLCWRGAWRGMGQGHWPCRGPAAHGA